VLVFALLAVLLVVIWSRRPRRATATLDVLMLRYGGTMRALAMHRVTVATMTGADRDAALRDLQEVERERARAERKIHQLAKRLGRSVVLPSDEEAEDAVNLRD
jgi:hypothetical protein